MRRVEPRVRRTLNVPQALRLYVEDEELDELLGTESDAESDDEIDDPSFFLDNER